jgi:sugar phosphate isomerase/epimerase
VRKLAGNQPALEERVRGKLVKQGGIGYESPTIQSFPAVDEFVQWVRACEAIPMAAWLDGTTAGERDPGALLDCLRAKGVAAVNIIPDRNWNFTDPAVRTLKISRLKDYVEAAEALAMPINIGTEMNRDGLPFVDDLGGEALKPHRILFIQGAQVMVGHGILSRYAGFSYVGAAAAKEFGTDIRAKNAFFAAAGALPALTRIEADQFVAKGPAQALDVIRKAVKTGKW